MWIQNIYHGILQWNSLNNTIHLIYEPQHEISNNVVCATGKVPHPTQDTNGKVTNSQLDTTNESQEVSPFPAGDHKAHINRRAQRHSKHKTEQNIKDPQKKYRLGTISKIFYWRALTSLTARQTHP